MAIYRKNIATPLGEMVACADDEGICLLSFLDSKHLARQWAEVLALSDGQFLDEENSHIGKLEQELNAYFSGTLRAFSIPISLVGTPFQKSVWAVLRQIPYGETWSYQQQAKALGSPKSVRAVANANGRNKIAFLVPCHRVIGSSGKLTGYAGGITRKEKLLQLEGAILR